MEVLNVLQIIQNLCKRQNVPVPTTVIGTTDPQIRQMVALLEEEGDDLAARHPWVQLTREATWTTTATEDQGAIDTLAASGGFRCIKNDTIWDRSTKLPVCGPMDPSQWQAMKALVSMGPRYRFRLRAIDNGFDGAHLLVNPPPPAGESWYFEYVSFKWIASATKDSTANNFYEDNNLINLPPTLVLSGLRWRWKKEKGLDYAEDFRTYEARVQDAMGQDGGKPRIYADDDPMRRPMPGIFVNPYNTVP